MGANLPVHLQEPLRDPRPPLSQGVQSDPERIVALFADGLTPLLLEKICVAHLSYSTYIFFKSDCSFCHLRFDFASASACACSRLHEKRDFQKKKSLLERLSISPNILLVRCWRLLLRFRSDDHPRPVLLLVRRRRWRWLNPPPCFLGFPHFSPNMQFIFKFYLFIFIKKSSKAPDGKAGLRYSRPPS